MAQLPDCEIWFITGSQHLYGDKALQQVAANSLVIARSLDEVDLIPVKIVHKPNLTRQHEVTELCKEANTHKKCIGLIAWMHTFFSS